MSPQEFGFADEAAFFDAACQDRAIQTLYRRFIGQIAAEEVDRISVPEGTAKLQRDALMCAAMEPFDRAFDIFARREILAPHDYPFSKYYRWWARQYALAHLHRRSRSLDEPQSDAA